MKLPTQPNVLKGTKTKAPPPVNLYVARNKAKEIVVATFDPSMIPIMTSKFGKIETHLAKAKTTGGMYGRLMALTGLARRGGQAFSQSATTEEKRAIAINANKARWGK